MDSKARQLMERFAVVHGANDRDAPKSYMLVAASDSFPRLLGRGRALAG